MPSKSNSQSINEVVGLILLGLGTLLFLALISYDPNDVPEWFPLSSASPANDPVQNFIGPFGAVLASIFYYLFGAASYLITAVMLGFGGAKLLSSNLHMGPRSLWIIGFLLSGTCIAQRQPWLLENYHREMNIPGTGGWLGYWIGERLLEGILGTVGSWILLVFIYVTSLILMTGIRPIILIRRSVALPRLWLEKYRQYQLAQADEREKLVLEQRRVAREAKRLEKELGRKSKKRPISEPVASPVAVSENLSEEEEIIRPEPQVIDTSVAIPRKAKPEPEKISLTEPQHIENYRLPSIDLLEEQDIASREASDPNELRAIQATLIETLQQFGISVEAGDITKGPTITRYEVYPARGVRVDKIVALERDLARATRAERINILAPIPGKDTVGIEIANSRKVKVAFRELLESEDWHSTNAKIPLALGKDVYGKTIIADLAKMPHCLVAGTTGSGKSVCINALIASMLYRFSPEEIRFIMIDPKVVEMQTYNKLPHLVVPVVTDPKKVLLALRWVIDEMEKRYKIFATTGVRNITSFNARPKPKSQKELDEEAETNSEEAEKKAPEVIDFSAKEDDELFTEEPTPPPVRVPREDDLVVPDHMPYIVVIIDELADLMQTAPADVESAIARITQMARAAGIHMIVATQTPRADVVTGVIKANIPSRIAFQVASKIDSRVILDENGAERLLGQGDMLYLPPGTSRFTRAQGVFVTDEEIQRVVEFAAAQGEPTFDSAVEERLNLSSTIDEDVSPEDEELVEKCLEIMRQEKKASTSLFQRRLRLGYTRAARVVDILEQRGYVAPGEGAKPREILVDLDVALP